MILPDDPDVVLACSVSSAYYDEHTMAWHCWECDAVLKGDGDCPRGCLPTSQGE